MEWENPDTPILPSHYIIVGGKRFVLPYYFEFIAHVKQRWSGKTIVDMFADEFRQRPYEYYVDAVRSGRILLEDKKCESEYRVRTTQKLSHFVHRHEPPVLAESIVILHEGPEVLTVCKPASIPVHTCGQYRKNTVLGILQAEHNTGPLFRKLALFMLFFFQLVYFLSAVHRLDRLVSGLLIFAKSAVKADKFRQDIENGRVRKVYVAKVTGVFPEEEVVVNAAVHYDAREGRSTVEVCEEQDSKGKEACTRFVRLSTDGVSSIVECKPLTGRTHQIRVHLQHLKHPIANDDLYLHENPPKRSKRGGTADSAARSGMSRQQQAQDSRKVDDDREEPSFETDPLCTHCPRLGPSGYDDDSDGLWLHCVQYSCEEWSFECPLPAWAS
ncbi:RNA pseudouridine synthase 7-like isoform X1 [Selaginella moellendorffii]|uniref:RNA pseudouridine synthase 7-like isoform X1 n=1 Tax=Selaginella moellendorffii TaxID=88036 RepID=UPI000D1CC67D|nr:RNA pseudouridine synthase 7-like isoform X1 [Selaginella moellendorffii]|eukprot:XP_024533773.1 RNA pseudouridine synthase 7-like isoform X1 [Selaginella moellendorffii]